MAKDSPKLNKEPYKGVRDFYPEDKARQNFIFDAWRKVTESFGYEEMDASILEPTELFESKTGEEIINEQTYTFSDRGGRRVTLRPEMTPTVARMIAQKKRELSFPVRWYSIANFFRYERPQKGRLREFFQINCDLFGGSGPSADFEIINLAYSLIKEFGVNDSSFEIRFNNRKFINFLMTDYFSLDEKSTYRLTKVLDKKNKVRPLEFAEQVKIILDKRSSEFLEIIDITNVSELASYNERLAQNEGIKEMVALFEKMDQAGIKNYRYEPTLTRGLDYYTGIVFEFYDTGKENTRSLFGGGRYDNLLEIFGEEALPTIGFAVGDVTMIDFLETYNLLPKTKSKTHLFICTLDEKFIDDANDLAVKLRKNGLNVAINLSAKKVGDQIALSSKKNIPFVICVGENEVSSGEYKLKNLESGEELILKADKISDFILGY